jgi:predicted membrane channel-forming protein YqfA (hemolysin III family)
MVLVVTKPGEPQGIISFHLNLISSVLCLSLSVNFHTVVTQHARLWFDRLRHISFGMVKSSQDTPCNNGIRSASPHGLRITYHAPLSSNSVDVKYHLKYP